MPVGLVQEQFVYELSVHWIDMSVIWKNTKKFLRNNHLHIDKDLKVGKVCQFLFLLYL